ncbi:MAG: hypothetical protein AAGF06_04915 [Pseudomonadota bacterium]
MDQINGQVTPVVEHISPAMRNVEATQSLFYVNTPSQLLDWSFLAIEAIILVGTILAIIHAWRYRQRTGSSAALLTFLNCLLYGLFMDILSYYTVENFWHGEFSVMLLFNKLPLYIAFFYPALFYHTVMMVRRYDFPPMVEAICTGLFTATLYMIFDNIGPVLGWWVWDLNNPTTLPYLDGVPLTSYHWIFMFTAVFALLNRFISWEWLEHGASKLKLTLSVLLQPVLTVFIGSLVFIPYNLFAQSSPPYDMLPWAVNLKLASLIHALFFGFAMWLFVSQWRKPIGQRDNLLMTFPFIFIVGHAFVYFSKIDLFMHTDLQGKAVENGLQTGNLMVAILAIVAASAMVLVTCLSNDDDSQ